MANFKKAYIEKHKAAIQKDLGLSNVMEIPKMEKIEEEEEQPEPEVKKEKKQLDARANKRKQKREENKY